MLQKKAYPYMFLQTLDTIAYSCMLPTFWLCNEVFSSCIILFYHEKKHCEIIFGRSLLYIIAAPFLYIIPLGVTVIWFVPFFLLWHILLLFRQPYLYSERKTNEFQSSDCFSIATGNLCIAPEFVTVLNSLPNTVERSKWMGRCLAQQQSKCWRICENNTCIKNSVKSPESIGLVHNEKLGVSTEFPALDVVCFQEMFDMSYCSIFLREIHQHFPYVVHDVRVDGWWSNGFCLSSGLMLASIHPILAVDFKVFKDRIKFCAWASKGLLMCKVLVGEENMKRKVGYIFTTHLQAYQGDASVLKHQLDSIHQWTTEFRMCNQAEDETVVCDIMCGDFNFDNLSPGDYAEACHPLFDKYEDSGRVQAGVDHDWTVGTERRQRTLHNSEVQTAEGLARCLRDPKLRRLHVLDADVHKQGTYLMTIMPEMDTTGEVIPSPVGGRRRIDYVLHDTADKNKVVEYKFVTQFASKTDHIPVSLTIKPR